MEYKDGPKEIGPDTIAKAFLSYICTIRFEPYSIRDNLSMKHKIDRLRNQQRRVGKEIDSFWKDATEYRMLRMAEAYDSEHLAALARDDDFGLLKAAAKADRSIDHFRIGGILIQTHNAYKKKMNNRPSNPKVLPAQIIKGLESLL